ncbi:phosphotransferase family protein [Arthrobacter sp. IK3]|uniref:phosphotransferase family protein n=1 Tax=Arthrobacter sp. IK3 TaxID=3448169 RepID=UPI003EDF53EB
MSGLQTTADGTEVVSTGSEAAALERPPLLVLDAVTGFLDAHGLGSGDLAWERIGDGQSNITYRIIRGGESFVLRRGPRPPLPRSTHDMVREARVQQLLGAEGIPVPQILAVCSDETLLGVPFYVMSYLDGHVITGSAPEHLDTPEQRGDISRAVVETLARLHSVDVTGPELSRLGRAEGYLERQVRRFAGLWEANTLRDVPLVAHLAQELGASVPASQRASVVHGDYRLGNLMFGRQQPATVTGILDWEMATLGDPLADLGYLAATYSEPGAESTVMDLTSVTKQPGYWSRDQLVAGYADRTGLDVSALPWYQALALWKSAIFCEAIYTRYLKGERPGDTFGPTLEEGVPLLLESAAETLRRS